MDSEGLMEDKEVLTMDREGLIRDKKL